MSTVSAPRSRRNFLAAVAAPAILPFAAGGAHVPPRRYPPATGDNGNPGRYFRVVIRADDGSEETAHPCLSQMQAQAFLRTYNNSEHVAGTGLEAIVYEVDVDSIRLKRDRVATTVGNPNGDQLYQIVRIRADGREGVAICGAREVEARAYIEACNARTHKTGTRAEARPIDMASIYLLRVPPII